MLPEFATLQAMRLLIVDDDPKFRGFMQSGLGERGFACVTAGDIQEAQKVLEEADRPFDLILLDVMLPDRSGWDFLSWLRQRGNTTPVIFVTARHAVEERVKGLELGADDYIIKPFEFSELLARAEAVLRRHRASTHLTIGDLEVDLERRHVRRAGRRIEMSPREYDLLLALIKARGRVVTRSELLHEVWGIDFDPGTNVVNVQIARLRRKLELPDRPPLIHTAVGKGYILSETPPDGTES